jgi:nucleoside-diphosphate-sugar epimerase
MANPILVTGAAGRVGGIGRTVTELLLKQGKAVRAMVRERLQPWALTPRPEIRTHVTQLERRPL